MAAAVASSSWTIWTARAGRPRGDRRPGRGHVSDRRLGRRPRHVPPDRGEVGHYYRIERLRQRAPLPARRHPPLRPDGRASRDRWDGRAADAAQPRPCRRRTGSLGAARLRRRVLSAAGDARSCVQRRPAPTRACRRNDVQLEGGCPGLDAAAAHRRHDGWSDVPLRSRRPIDRCHDDRRRRRCQTTSGRPRIHTTSARSPIRRPMSARSIDEPHRAASQLELLFDLTFVVAVASVTVQLAHVWPPASEQENQPRSRFFDGPIHLKKGQYQCSTE